MSTITHVSDTALMVAACRALETEAPDGFIRDPFAAQLAGERGHAILENIPRADMLRFGVAVRTRVIDELLAEALATNTIKNVLSVGSGLDTRPWRLDLPSHLRWIEVDFAPMLDYKHSIMATEAPRCRVERLTADVNDPMQRQLIYDAASREESLMITEGLLMYLPASTIDELASEAWRQSGIKHWIADIMSTNFAKAVGASADPSVQRVQSTESIPGEQIVEHIRHQGWETAAHRSYITGIPWAMERGARLMGATERPSAPPPFVEQDPTGVHRFAHA